MRLCSGFFAPLHNQILNAHQHSFKIDIPADWNWFFLSKTQLFIFFQDPVHLVTKWRNRLLSSTANLWLGKDRITMTHIESLISNDKLTKLDHGLTKSDINPRDRQNFRSCLKLITDDVLNLLANRDDTNGTYVYLKLLSMVVKAFVNKSTSLTERE